MRGVGRGGVGGCFPHCCPEPGWSIILYSFTVDLTISYATWRAGPVQAVLTGTNPVRPTPQPPLLCTCTFPAHPPLMAPPTYLQGVPGAAGRPCNRLQSTRMFSPCSHAPLWHPSAASPRRCLMIQRQQRARLRWRSMPIEAAWRAGCTAPAARSLAGCWWGRGWAQSHPEPCPRETRRKNHSLLLPVECSCPAGQPCYR